MAETIVKVGGEHGEALGSGRAVPLAVLVFYPDKEQIVVVGMDVRTKEETIAMLRKFWPGSIPDDASHS